MAANFFKALQNQPNIEVLRKKTEKGDKFNG
jgi:hypothetical protein